MILISKMKMKVSYRTQAFHVSDCLFSFLKLYLNRSYTNLNYLFVFNAHYSSLEERINNHLFVISYIIGRWASNEPPSLYMFINCSTRELAGIEKFVVWSFSLVVSPISNPLIFLLLFHEYYAGWLCTLYFYNYGTW